MKPRVTHFLLAASATIILSGIAHAASGSWTGATDATWAGANWSAAPVPGTGDTATFNGAGNANTTISVSGVVVKTISFDTSAAAAYTLGTSGSEILNLNDTGSISVATTVTNSQTVAANLVLGTATASTYSLINNGAGSLTFSGNIQGGTGGAAGAKTLTIGGSGDSLVSAVIDKGGASSLILAKTGSGTLTLNKANTYNGATSVTGGGTLKLDFAAGGAPTTNIVLATSPLALNGGNLTVNGATTAGTSQTFASTAVGAGRSNLTAAPASGANLPSVALGAVTFAAGSSVKLTGPATIDGAGAVPATATITTTTVGAGSLGLLGGIALGGVGAVATVGLYDWPSTSLASGAAGTSPYTILGGSQVTGFYQTTGITTAGNYDFNSAGVNSIANAGGATTVRFNTPGGTNTITNTAFTFQNMQGILVTPNMAANNAIILGTGTGALSFRRATSSGVSYGVLWQNNTLGYLRLDIPLSAGRQAGQTNGLVQAGPGTVTYSSASNYELQTFLNGGCSLITGNGAFGNQTTASVVNLNGGTIVGNATFALDNAGANKRPITLLNSGGGIAASATNTLSVTGAIGSAAGAGALTIGIPASSANGNVTGLLPGSGPGTANTTAVDASGTVALSGANFHTGGTVVVSGVLNINGINALGGANYGGLTLKGTTLQYAANFTGNGSGDLTSVGTAGITLAAGGGSIDTNGNDVTYAGSIGNGGVGGLTKVGSGTLTLGGANNYSGGSVISGGTLSVTNTTGSGTGSGAVTVNAGGTLAGSGIISGTATVSGGTVAPGAAGTILTAGGLTYNSGALNFSLNGAGPSSSRVNITNATFTATPTISFNGAATVSNGQSYTLLTSTNPITGAAFLSSIAPTVVGRITLAPVLSGNSIVVNATGSAGNLVWAGGVSGLGGSVTGDTTTWNNTQTAAVAGNWNNAGNRDYFYDGDNVTFNDAGTPNYTVNLTTNNAPSTVSVNSTGNYSFTGAGSITGSTGLVKSGSGKLTLSTANTYTGGTTVNAGTLAIGASNALPTGGLVTVQGTGTLDLGGFSPSPVLLADGGVGTGAITSSSPATLTLSSALLTTNTFSGTINGSVGITKVGLGSLVLSGNNGFTGGVTINEGVLVLGNDGALNLATPNAVSFSASSTGKLQLNGHSVAISGLTTGTPTGTPVVENANATPATLTVSNGADGTYAGVLQDGTGGGALSLIKSAAGNLTLSGANTFSGTTVISGGTLTTGTALALGGSTLDYNNQGGVLSFGTLTAATLGGLSGAQNLALVNSTPAAVTLTIGNNGQATTYSGVLSGSGSLVKTGAGVTTLTAVNTYAGSTAVNGGALELAGSGSISSTTVAVTGNSTLRLANAGTSLSASGACTVNNAGTVFPVLHLVDGSASLNGELTALGQANNGYRIQVDAGTLTTSNLRLGRGSLAFTTEAAAVGSTTQGLYVNGGTVNVSGFMEMGVVAGANSSVSALVASGTLNVTGKVTVGINNTGRWSVLQVSGGEFNSTDTTDGVLLGGPLAGSSVFAVSGGVAKVERIQLGQGTLTGNGVVRVSGGELYLGSGGIVKVSPNVTTEVRLVGGTLGAKAAWSTSHPINLGGSGTTVSVIKAANALDAPVNITLTGAVTGGGSLEKTGTGTLTLGGGNAYTGNTLVSAGTLKVQTKSFNDDASLSVEAGLGALLNLDYSGGDRVAVFNIDGSAQDDGVYGSMANTTPGINHTPAIVGSGLLYVNTEVPPSPYDTWAAGKGLTLSNSGPTQDPDNDGISNVLEFVLGGDPLASSTGILPTLAVGPSNFVFSFTRSDESEQEVALTFQYGSNLSGWTPVVVGADTASSGTGVVVTENAGAADTITVTIPKGANTELFGRLKADQ